MPKSREFGLIPSPIRKRARLDAENVLLAVMIACAAAGYIAVSYLIEALRRGGAKSREAPGGVTDAAADEVVWARGVLRIEGFIDAAGLKTRYREMLSQYHPDKTERLGPELRQMGAEKTQDIIRAFEILSRRIVD